VCVCVGEVISLSWFSNELKNDLLKNNYLRGVILILLVRESIFVGWGSPFPIVQVPRYKLSLCHTPIKPNLLGFPGIGIYASGLCDHVITRFTSTCHPQIDGQTEVVNQTLSSLLRPVIHKNLKSWDTCLPIVEFAFNHSVHGATKFSPFEVVYSFNPCVVIDHVHIPIDERTSKDGIRKAELMKKLHEQVRLHIEEKTTKYAKQANKGQKMVRFKPKDLVWIHISRGRFPSKRKSKLMPRVDGPFRITEKVNDNAYKVDLPGDFNVSATFNMKDLTPYLDGIDDTDLRTNHSQPGANDVHHGNYNPSCKAEPNLQEDSDGPITRTRAK